MPHRFARGAAVLLALLILVPAALAADGSAAALTKRGASGQVYVWHAGSC